MKQTSLKIIENTPLTESVYRMTLVGETGDNKPGQFVNVKLDGFYLRRPISVCDCENGVLTLIFKVVGHGTEAMAKLEPGTELDVLTCLGNGYDLEKAGDSPLLIGGGVGVPPLYMLAKELREQGRLVSVILGFNTKDEVFYEDEFISLGCAVTVTTVDGSYGEKGFVTDLLPGGAAKAFPSGEGVSRRLTDEGQPIEEYPLDIPSYFYACGPLPMLKAVHKALDIPGEMSLEERMGCGFGACMGCSIETKNGPKRVCKEGPVFRKEELLW